MGDTFFTVNKSYFENFPATLPLHFFYYLFKRNKEGKIATFVLKK